MVGSPWMASVSVLMSGLERPVHENFCRAQQLSGFNFPSTPIGWFAYSEEVCPTGTSGAGKSEASTRCSTINGSPSFEPKVQRLQCDQTLSDIQQNLTSPADLESLASSTQILTSQPEELTAENVTTAAQIVDRLLRSPNATESVRVAAVATVSQLLSAADVSQENNSTLGLTETLDELSVNLTLGLNTTQSQVVQPNLVVQSAQIPAADTQGVQFTSLSGTSGSFVADRIELNTNTSTVVVENGFVADALIYVRFPAEAAGVRQKPPNVSLGFVLYQNDRFFRSRRYRRQRATTRVLSATLGGQDHSLVPDHVEIMFRPTMLNGTSLYNFACVFWNYDVSDWSTDGCSKGNASDGLLRCFCNHTTNFAALWTYREKYDYAEALDWISIVGLSLSIVCLVVTIGHHIKENFRINSKEETNNMNSKIARLCIYVSLLAFIVTFLSGVQNSSRQNDAPVGVDDANTILDSDERVEPDRGSCTAVAALLHFFLLATFMWNSVYSTQMAILAEKDKELPPHWSIISHTVGWGLPAVVMATTLGATYRLDSPLGYRQEEFCWLAALDKNKQFNFGKPMFWAFLLPVALILIYNIIMVFLATCKTDGDQNSTNPSSLRMMFINSLILSMLLGVSWTLGYLVLASEGTAHLVFSIIFCLCTTTQGLQIFILFTAKTLFFQASMSRPVRYISAVKMHLNKRFYSLTKVFRKRTHSESYGDLNDQQESLF
ncbi:adhesion G-protein coupled receptor G7 [Acanthopagrus schlegelii]